MSVDYREIHQPSLSTLKGEAVESHSSTRGGRDESAAEHPLVVMRGGHRVLFGPGLDDFNEFDDPC